MWCCAEEGPTSCRARPISWDHRSCAVALPSEPLRVRSTAAPGVASSDLLRPSAAAPSSSPVPAHAETAAFLVRCSTRPCTVAIAPPYVASLVLTGLEWHVLVSDRASHMVAAHWM